MPSMGDMGSCAPHPQGILCRGATRYLWARWLFLSAHSPSPPACLCSPPATRSTSCVASKSKSSITLGSCGGRREPRGSPAGGRRWFEQRDGKEGLALHSHGARVGFDRWCLTLVPRALPSACTAQPGIRGWGLLATLLLIHHLSWGTAGLAAPRRNPAVAKGSALGWGRQLPGSSPWSLTLCLHQAAPAPWSRAMVEPGRLSSTSCKAPGPSLQL